MKYLNKNESTKSGQRVIFFVWNYLEWGGVQIYFLGLMRGVAQKYRVKAILPESSDKKILKYLEDNHIEYDFFQGKMDLSNAETIGRRIGRRWNDFQTNLSLAKHLSRYNLRDAIVQIDVAPWAGFLLLLYLTFRTDVFVTFHTALPQHLSFGKRILWKTKFALLTALRRFHLAASNQDVKKSLRRYLSEARYRQIEVVYSSVNAGEIRQAFEEKTPRGEIARRYNFPADKIWVCNVAQFIERKGCWVFLEAIARLQNERSDLFFYWLGTAPLSAEVSRRIEEYDLKNNFRFLSADEIGASRKDLLTIWAAADLFVLPSFQEGLPVALLEAMALGKACIASRVNAIPEAVVHLETGVLVEAGDSTELAAAIGDLASDENLRKKLGANARRLALENFEERVIGQKMVRLYESV